jgi:SAM-dependent methyltransferase
MHWLVVIVGALMVLTGIGLLFLYLWPVISPLLPPWFHKGLAEGVTCYSAGYTTIVSRVYIGPGMRVLDIGCGTGRLALPISRRVYPSGEVIAIDVDEKAVEKFNHKIAHTGYANIETYKADIKNVDLPPDAFDRVFLVATLGSIQDKEDLFRQIYSATKPGGILSVTEVAFDTNKVPMLQAMELAKKTGFLQDFGCKKMLNYTLNFVKPGHPEPPMRTSEEDTKYLQPINQYVVPVKTRGHVFTEYKPVIPREPEPEPGLEDVHAERARIKDVRIREPGIEPAKEKPLTPVPAQMNDTKIEEIKTTPKLEAGKIAAAKLEDVGEEKSVKEREKEGPKEPEISKA